jgi:hypothetical protein
MGIEHKEKGPINPFTVTKRQGASVCGRGGGGNTGNPDHRRLKRTKATAVIKIKEQEE